MKRKTILAAFFGVLLSLEGQAAEPYVSVTVESSDELREDDPMSRAELGVNFQTEHWEFDVFGWHKSSLGNGFQYAPDRNEQVDGVGVRFRWEPFR